LIAGTLRSSPASTAEVYSYSSSEGQSYELKFRAASDDAGEGEQNGLLNTGSIFFSGEDPATGAAGSYQSGRFVFSHGIVTSFGAYDLAEDYATRDDLLRPGDLVSLDRNERTMVRRSSGKSDRDVIGVYSSEPALRLSQKEATIDGALAVPVALAGRVPVRVSLENGPVRIGDYLVPGTEPGTAARAAKPGRAVGRALSAYSGAEGEEPYVTVFIGVQSVGWDDIESAGEEAEELAEGSSAEPADGLAALVSAANRAAEDIALALIRRADLASAVVADRLTALVASVRELFVQTLSVLPGGSIFLPSGENQISGEGEIPAEGKKTR